MVQEKVGFSPWAALPGGVCLGVCSGDHWVLTQHNEHLARFVDHPGEALEGESFFTLLYKLHLSAAVEAIKSSQGNQTVLFQANGKCFTFVWSEVSHPKADAVTPPPAGTHAELLRIFILHEVPPITDFADYDILRQEFNVILDSVHDGIWIIDANGITVHVNKALDRIAGIKAEDVIGKHVTAPMEAGQFTSCVTLTALEQQQAITLFDDYASGKRCLNTSTPIFDDNGKIVRVVASIRDMSELESLQMKLAEAERKARHYKEKLERSSRSNNVDFIGSSSTMYNCLRALEKAARVPSGVLMLGETGTGKTFAAHYVHQKSARAQAPFVTVNCAAIPSTLIESELFGYEKGAFTGAVSEGKKGFFELADKGILFLDEIGELPLNMQAKLLHVLDSFSFHRVGGVKKIQVDVRILAATNKPLEQLVKAGEFRADLYYRLRVLTVTIPPLRDHAEDVSALATHFLEEACKRHGTNKFFDPKVLDRFALYSWPGNVRELQATVEFLAAMAEGSIIKLRDLPPQFDAGTPGDEDDVLLTDLKTATQNLECKMIREALARTGSTYKAAARLGVSQSTVVRKAQRLGINVPDMEPEA